MTWSVRPSDDEPAVRLGSGPLVPGAGRSLLLRVLGHPLPCPRCGRSAPWVLALRPVHNPSVDELVTCDHPDAIAIARTLLSAVGQTAQADGLRARPADARGKSYNPNACAVCGEHPDWYTFDGLIVVAYHEGFEELAVGRCPVPAWRHARRNRNYVIPY